MTNTREVAELKRQAEETVSQHRAAVKRLYFTTPGGEEVPKFDAEQTEQMRRKLDAERNKALRGIEEAVNEIHRDARQAAEAAANFPPDEVLDTFARSAARERLPLVEGDVAALDTSALVERLRGVARSGTKTDKYLYWQAARKRRRELLQQQARARTQAAGGFSQPGSGATPLDGVIGELDRCLFQEERARRSASHEARMQEARELGEFCYTRRHDAEDLATAYAKQADAHIHKWAKDQGAQAPPPPSSGGGPIAQERVRGPRPFS